jgi:cell division protein FtsB
MLVAGAELIGVKVPSNAVFGIGLLYVTLNVLSVTIAASSSAAQVRRLAQECALLRAELEALRGTRTAGTAEAERP